ncbi:hypothetical protein TYRP_018832 [Tyrophagus putrescentiae]|nr:hypothetical protein TYRP_018832 [Tyrophagus putrescentiae]
MGSLGLKARGEMTVCFVHQLEMDKKVNGVILEEKVLKARSDLLEKEEKLVQKALLQGMDFLLLLHSKVKLEVGGFLEEKANLEMSFFHLLKVHPKAQ